MTRNIKVGKSYTVDCVFRITIVPGMSYYSVWPMRSQQIAAAVIPLVGGYGFSRSVVIRVRGCAALKPHLLSHNTHVGKASFLVAVPIDGAGIRWL